MAIQTDLLSGVIKAFNASPVRFQVDGGLHHRRAPARVVNSYGQSKEIGETVYGVVRVEPTGRQFTSGSSIEDFDVFIQIYSGSSITDAGAIQTAIDGLRSSLSVPSPNRVLRVKPSQEALELSDLEVGLKDLHICTIVWAVKIQVERA